MSLKEIKYVGIYSLLFSIMNYRINFQFVVAFVVATVAVFVVGVSTQANAQTEPEVEINKVRSVKILNATNTTMNLHWEETDLQRGMYYEISYSNIHETSAGVVESQTNSVALTGLWEGEWYVVRVRATNGDVVGDWSKAVVGTTTFRNTRVKNVQVDFTNQDTVEISWDPVEADGYYRQEDVSPIGYHINWKQQGQSWSRNFRDNSDYSHTLSHEITGLQPATTYNIRVRAYRRGEFGLYGQWSNVFTTQTNTFLNVDPVFMEFSLGLEPSISALLPDVPTAKKLDNVGELLVANQDNGVFDISWDEVDGAEYYEVYYTTSSGNCVDYTQHSSIYHSRQYVQTKGTSLRVRNIPASYVNIASHLKHGVVIVWVRATQGTTSPIIFSDWADACVANSVTPTQQKDIPESNALSLEQAVGQMLLVGFNGGKINAGVTKMIQEVQPGGVVLFDRKNPSNITSPEQVSVLTTEIQAVSPTPMFVAIDAEGGYVNRFKTRYGFPVVVPSAENLGKDSPQETQRIATQLAAELQDAGVNLNLAPVVDVNLNPTGPAIGWLERSFSADPDMVVEHASAFMDGMSEQNIIPTLKHFPGHGSSTEDTHLGVTDVTDTYQQDIELEPYKQIFAQGYNDPVMTAHIVNNNLDSSSTPATLSYAILTDLLRNDLGFDGVIISDDMQMGAIVEEYGSDEAVIGAIQAGVDVILIANFGDQYSLETIYQTRDAIIQAVRNGEISEERIYESVERILELKRRYNLGS